MKKNRNVIVPLKPAYRNMTGSVRKLLKVLYPYRCPVCDEVITQSEYDAIIHNDHTSYGLKSVQSGSLHESKDCMTHKKCLDRLIKCNVDPCLNLKLTDIYFDGGKSLFIRNDTSRNMIYNFKYHYKRSIGTFLGSQMACEYADIIKSWKIDAIAIVPLHKTRLAGRGFNQSLDIAKSLQEELFLKCGYAIPLLSDLITRVKKTSRQKDLSDIQRQYNIQNAFAYNKNLSILNKRILVIDDIFTTGATINEIARVLKAYGAERVYFLAGTASDVV